MLLDEEIPRNLPERTGRHLCVRCLREVPGEKYLQLDYLCMECAAVEQEFPLASTPGDSGKLPGGKA